MPGAEIRVRHDWYCPACGKEDETFESRPHSRFRQCPKMRGLVTPLLPKGTKAKMEIKERDDYIGAEKVQYDPEHGRPVMSIVTTRDDGQDAVVFAPTATGSIR